MGVFICEIISSDSIFGHDEIAFTVPDWISTLLSTYVYSTVHFCAVLYHVASTFLGRMYCGLHSLWVVTVLNAFS